MKAYTTKGARGIAGLLMIVLPSLALAGSSIAKFAIPAVQNQMGKLGFAGGKLTFIAILEIIGAASFILPHTAEAIQPLT